MQYAVVKNEDLLKTKNQLLCKLGIKTPFNKLAILGDILF